MITPEIKLEIIRRMIISWIDKRGMQKSPKEQGAFLDKLLEIIRM